MSPSSAARALSPANTRASQSADVIRWMSLSLRSAKEPRSAAGLAERTGSTESEGLRWESEEEVEEEEEERWIAGRVMAQGLTSPQSLPGCSGDGRQNRGVYQSFHISPRTIDAGLPPNSFHDSTISFCSGGA